MGTSAGTRHRPTTTLGPSPGALSESDRLALTCITGAAVAAVVCLASGHLAAAVVGHGWPRYRPAEGAGILARVLTNLHNPRLAWDPVNRGGAVPGPVIFWAVFAVVAAIPLAFAYLALRSRPSSHSAAWATLRNLRRLRVRGQRHGRLVVGTVHHQQIAVEARHSLLVLGPTQTGKTTGLAIPAILDWPGPVVATSVKTDLVIDTIGHRSERGDVLIFDPAGCTPFPRSHWTPLAGCGTWAGAMRAAWELTSAAKSALGNSMAVGDFWFDAAAKALAPLLLAAHHSNRTIADVARWVDREERDEPLDILRTLESDAVIAHEATFRREERGRSSLIQVMQAAVGPYLDPAVAESARRSDIVAEKFLDGGVHTLYLTAPPDEQDRFRPLFTALLSQIVVAAYRKSAEAGGPLDPPLLIVLDEAANIAPVENLPTIAATAASMGVQIITVFQDLAQIRLRYKDAAGTVVNNHRAKLLLPAVSDLDTLDLASRLVGDEEIDRDSETIDTGGRRSATTSTQWRRLLPPELANRLDDGEAVLLYGNLPPTRLRLRPWYANRRLRRLASKKPPLAPTPTEPRSPVPAATQPGGAALTTIGAARAQRARRLTHGR